MRSISIKLLFTVISILVWFILLSNLSHAGIGLVNTFESFRINDSRSGKGQQIAAVSDGYNSESFKNTTIQPISQLGIAQKLRLLSRDWGLILQVDNECPHCHTFAPIVLEFANQYGFVALAVSFDGTDFGNIPGVVDSGQMQAFNPNRDTPILYLVRDNGSEVFIISRGINSIDQIIDNINDINNYTRLF